MIPGIIDLIFLRFTIPFVLFIVTVVRYNGFSFIYLLFLLACPLLEPPKCPRSTTKVQVYLILLITLSCVFTLSHPTLHIVLTVAPPYENALRTCQDASIAAQIGVQRLEGMLPYRAMRLVLPDIFVLSVAVTSLVYFSRRRRVPSTLLSSPNALSAAESSIASHIGDGLKRNTSVPSEIKSNRDDAVRTQNFDVKNSKLLDQTHFNFTSSWNENQRKLWRAWALDSLRMLTTVLLVCFAGITSPSLPSGVYLLSFLAICTYWACRNEFSPIPFASLRIFLLVYSGLHVCLYYLYQFPFFQAFCKDGSFLARLLGLYYIMHTSCEKPGEIIFPDSFRIVDCLAPPITMLLYYVLVIETRRWLDSHSNVLVQTLFRNNVKDSMFPGELSPNGHDENVDDEINVPNTREPVSHEDSPSLALPFTDSCSSTKLTTAVSALPNDHGNEDLTLRSQSDLDNHDSELHPNQSVIQEHSLLKECAAIGHEKYPLSHDTRPTKEEILEERVSHIPKALAIFPHQVPSKRPQQENNYDEQFLSSPVEPHFDALFGLTPPFATYMYGWSRNNVATERPFLLSLHYSAIRNSYILTLIAMMAWAVVYRSWLSFILLLSACILWIVPKSRAACLYSSPLIVLYAIVLILIQYIYGLNLNSDELPQTVTPDGLQLSELGMQRSDHCVGALALQMGFLVCFWLTLRLFVMERAARQLTARHQQTVVEHQDSQMHSGSTTLPNFQKSLPTILKFRKRRNKDNGNNLLLTPFSNIVNSFQTHAGYNAGIYGPAASFGTIDNTIYRRFTDFMHSMCVKYWIVVCCLSMLLVSVQQPVVIFRIVYMVMLVYFMLIFQISYAIWRRQMLCFWWVIVVYSMAMLLCIYTYQFNESPNFWQNKLHLSPEILKAFGLETFESAALFERLLTPVVFLVVIILQVHYFHIPFLKASALNRFQLPQVSRGSVHSRSGVSDNHNSNTSISVSSNMSNFIEDVNSAFQIVVSKLYCWAVSLSNHCWRFLEIHWIKVVGLVVVLTCTNEVSAANIISLIFLVICFPFPYLHGFMTTFVFIWTSIQILCKMTFQLSAIDLNISSSCLKFQNSTTPDPTKWLGFKKVDNFRQYIMPYCALLVVSVIWHAVAYRQRQFYNNDRNTRPAEGTVFPGVTINSMGYDLLNVVKFAFNYGFYKFGLELCHCVTVVTTCARVDAFSVLYLMLMLVFLFSPRQVCARLWPSYMVILAVLIPIQYASCIGLPPGLCLSYPWFTESVEINNLLQWLYLPSDFGAPSPYKLSADFFQFAAVALQFRVFKIEQRSDSEIYGGGSNRPILTNELPNEGDRDFVSTKESYLDYMRHLIFYWSYWVSLAVVLVTGVVWITLFCLGYMILSFIYLWMGLNVLLRERTSLINSWNVIIGYNFCVILAKCSLQLMGCVYRSRMFSHCWLIQLFGVQCMNPLSWNHFNLPPGHETSCATVSSGLHWDIICFIFILFQRKVFTSHSFSHVLLDLQVQSRFASRGAYLINRKLMLAIHEQAMEEKHNLAKVQQKLNLIQQRQEAFGRSNANITEHYIMLRSGDYYLFEGDPEEDDDFVNRQTHMTTGHHDSDHSEQDNSSPHATMLRLRENKHGLKLRKATAGEEVDKQATTSSKNNRTKSQVTLVPNGKNYLRDIWPSIDPNILNILSDYNDPYSTISNERRHVRLPSHGKSAESDCHHEHLKYFDIVQDRAHPGFILGHRRMRSHPEFLRRHFGGNEKGSIVSVEPIEPEASVNKDLALRSVQTSPSPFSDKIASQSIGRRDQNVPPRHRPHVTHRRLFSASEAIFPSKDRPSSPEKNMAIQNTGRSHRRPTKSSLTKSSSPKFRDLSQIQNPAIPNKITEASNSIERNSEKFHRVADNNKSENISTTFAETHSHNTISKNLYSESQHKNNEPNTFSYSYFDDGQEADKDSDEDDDANPPSTANSRLNPIQLLNRAMELGALSTVRQYKRSLYANSQGARQREHTDNGPSNMSTGSQDGSSADQIMQPSSSMHQVTTDSFHHHSFKDTTHPNQTKGRKRNIRLHSKSGGMKKLSVPDIHSRSRQPEVHFSNKLYKKSYSPLVDNNSDTNEFCCNDPSGDYVEQRSASEFMPLKNHADFQDHCRHHYKPNFNSLYPMNSLHESELFDGKTLSRERNKYPLKDNIDIPSEQKGVKLNIFSNQSNPSSYCFIDKQNTEQDDQIITQRKFVKNIHSSQPFSDNNGFSDVNDNGNASPYDKTRRHSVHQHAESCWSKFKASCLIAYMFFLSSVDSLIRFLNGLTRQYRRIRRTIDQEKRLVKRRVISNNPFTNEQSRVQLEAAVLEIISTTPERQLSLLSPQHIETNPQNNVKRSSEASDYLIHHNSLDNFDNTDLQDHEREKAFRQSRSYGFLLLIAVGNLAIVYSELFCYFLLIFNHMRSSSLLSLPYPLMVLLWGMLSVPRPTKTFWIFLITYTEIVIVIKYIFQFKFFHFNDATLRPIESAEALWLPRILGINKNDDYAVFDLVQLISLFLHRGYLKNNGLWRDYTEFTHDLELIVQENKAVELSHSKQAICSRPLASSCIYLNKLKTDVDKDDGLYSSVHNTFVQQYPQSSHFPVPTTGGKTWNPLVKLKRFYLKMTDPRYNKKVDVYIYMFLCEFIAFWIILFGYVSFGPSTGMGDNAFEFLKSNRIPFPFISMLLVQFIFIIIDRGLFLQKQVLGKFIFQIIHVVLIHGWLFFILPHITRSPFTSGLAPQLLYLIKCVYFSLSAYQIRSGYPRRILGNFLTKNYNYINLVLFKGYLLLPFLYELRNVMDWMWTSSALSLYHWMELEDVYSKIFILKCWRRSELAYPTPRGQNRDISKKALTGGLLLLFFFICFWGPMALTSFIGATFDVNPPVLCTFSFSFGGFPPTFEFTSREGNIFTVNASELNNFIRCHEKDKQTFGFLHNFEWNDLRYVTIDGFSGNIWAITPPSYQALLMKLRSADSDLLLHFHMKCRRSTKEIQSSHTSVEDIFSRKLSPLEKLQLLMVLNSTNSIFPSSDYKRNTTYTTFINNDNMSTMSHQSRIDSVTLNAVLPRYVLLKKDKLRGAYAFLGNPQTYVNVSFHMHQDLTSRQAWWELKEKTNNSPTSDPCFEVIRHPTLSINAIEANVLSILTFNERVSDSLFGKVFNNYGIIGMYAAYIFLASRLLRTMYSNISYVIRLEELPHVDRILNLCHEIYLVRENNLLLLEEQLVAKLFFLYRSSETMIKWTRHPKHIVERFTSKPTAITGSQRPLPPPPPLFSGSLYSSGSKENRNNYNRTNTKPPVHSRRVQK
ncbi:Piezo-type mechanosensitive ion channel component 2 [Schistosoma japonicum]|uniref:Piezo-type mechanosensitive ion channel component 2 n=1 Tax=Schistosoma japonicum TaxID=6182 RepID=A0A4Z2DRN6_SCHJA|nr:Piezo-type mechanosensitive ion channel component 2 [Schistosoma japonicum]